VIPEESEAREMSYAREPSQQNDNLPMEGRNSTNKLYVTTDKNGYTGKNLKVAH